MLPIIYVMFTMTQTLCSKFHILSLYCYYKSYMWLSFLYERIEKSASEYLEDKFKIFYTKIHYYAMLAFK